MVHSHKFGELVFYFGARLRCWWSEEEGTGSSNCAYSLRDGVHDLGKLIVFFTVKRDLMHGVFGHVGIDQEKGGLELRESVNFGMSRKC